MRCSKAIIRQMNQSSDGNFDSSRTLLDEARKAFAEGRAADAVELLGRARAIAPNDAGVAFNLGLALKSANRPQEAEAAYRACLELDSGFAPAHGALGVALAAQGRLEAAAAALEEAVRLEPRLALGWANLAVVLKDLDRLDAAQSACRQLLALEPADPSAFNTLGDILRRRGRADEAAAAFKRAMALAPGWSHPVYNLGGLKRDQGLTDQAIALYEEALRLDPGLTEARWALAMAELAPIYDDKAEVERRRAAYAQRLKDIEDDYPGRAIEALGSGVGASQPFHLAYQGRNDRALQQTYGRLVRRALAPVPLDLPGRPKPAEPIRVAIVSGYFHHHANWRAPIRGWLEQLDRARFRLFGYHTGAVADGETARAQALCERFVQGPLPEADWVRAIMADQPHVILYPEVGMDPMVLRLAARRLARTQCVSWGHPTTSGLQNIDHFLSSDLMEPEDGQDHYSEALVRLPNLSIYYEPPAVAPAKVTRDEFGLHHDVPLFWCGQSLYKFQPGLDAVFPRIARAVGACRFLFLEFPGSPALTERFRTRLARTFSAFGLDADQYIAILPRLSQERFLGAAGLCDVTLDSIGWSGCNTLLEGMVHDTPIVTLPGALMRGRHGAAILQRMGLDDLIATDVEDYVAKAARLLLEPAFAAETRARIAAGKTWLYRDRECIRALEDFLETTART